METAAAANVEALAVRAMQSRDSPAELATALEELLAMPLLGEREVLIGITDVVLGAAMAACGRAEDEYASARLAGFKVLGILAKKEENRKQMMQFSGVADVISEAVKAGGSEDLNEKAMMVLN